MCIMIFFGAGVDEAHPVILYFEGFYYDAQNIWSAQKMQLEGSKVSYACELIRVTWFYIPLY